MKVQVKSTGQICKSISNWLELGTRVFTLVDFETGVPVWNGNMRNFNESSLIILEEN